MKYKLCVALVCLLGALLLLTSCFGGSKDEYAALSADYTSLEKEYTLLQEESEALKSELAKTKQQLDELGTRLDQTNAYVQVYSIYADTHRWNAGLPVRFGYAGPSSDPASYLQLLLDMTNALGDDELSAKLAQALDSPQGPGKDRAWAEWHVLIAERIDTLTRP